MIRITFVILYLSAEQLPFNFLNYSFDFKFVSF